MTLVSHRNLPLVRHRIAFHRLVPALITARVRAANLRLQHESVAAGATEVLDTLPSVRGVLLEKGIEARVEALDHVRPHRLVEHGRGADLHRSAAEEEVRERLGKARDPADARKRPA